MNKAKTLYLSILRNKNTKRAEFRRVAEQLTHVLANESLAYLPTSDVTIETPEGTTAGVVRQCSVMLLPILRSGITMMPIFLHYIPDASIGIIGIKRDEKTAEPHLYYQNFPPISAETYVMILDPMIATGGTGSMTINILTSLNIAQEHIIYCSMICAPEGIGRLKGEFPRVTFLTAAIDKGLNPHKFIIPGIGDFGDRYFGTIR